jgi:PAS domain S-box-containing protein
MLRKEADVLDEFFLTGPLPFARATGVYNYPLVVLSFAVASLASYMALVLARYLSVPREQTIRRLLQWGGALALGAGIWAMHFIGMLAFDMGMPMGYDPVLTVLSLVVAVCSAYGVLLLVSRPQLKSKQIVGGGILLGAGISTMHYLGMRAMVMGADMRYQPGMFALSIGIAILASGAALWISFTLARHTGPAKRWLQFAGATIMGVAICGMHYTGMAAAVFLPHTEMSAVSETFSANGEGLGVAIIGVILSIVLPVIVYFTIRDDQASDARAHFPTKLLSFAAVFTFAVLACTAVIALHSRQANVAGPGAADAAATLSNSLGWISFIAIVAAVLLATIWIFASRSIRRWQRELYDNKTLLQTILDHMPLALFVKDAAHDYRWLFLNRTAEDMFCLKGVSVSGRADHELFPAQEAESFRATDEKVMADGKLVDIPAESMTTPQGTFLAHTIKVPIYDDNGRPHILLGMTEDVTAKIKASEDLRLAKERAERADQAKSEFLANMSHELRTPLNSILGMTRLLQDSGITPDQQTMTTTVLTSSVALLDIVNDILDLSKIEAGAVHLEHIGFDPFYVKRSVVDIAGGPYVLGDPARFARVLTNLIGNAIKYTEQGKVGLKTTVVTAGDKQILYRCEISDTGVGIPINKQEGIFGKFVQGDNSTTRRYGGTGLGLAITKELVEMMGGTIGFESEAGKGSTFWFELPFTVTDELHRERDTRRVLPSFSALKPAATRILIAEDHLMNQVFIQKVMQRIGIPQIKIVGNGVAVVEQYQQGGWDMILMDCHMPERNGYDATIEIRKFEKQIGTRIPIIAMTADAMRGSRERCLSSGMDDYISKPIILEDFVRLLGQWIDMSAFVALTPSSPDAPAGACVDLREMRTFCEGDKNAERELIDVFIKQSALNLDVMAANLRDGANEAWVDAAHMLKGGSSSIGARRLSELCAAAQMMETASAAERSALLEKINEAYAGVRRALVDEGLLT